VKRHKTDLERLDMEERPDTREGGRHPSELVVWTGKQKMQAVEK